MNEKICKCGHSKHVHIRGECMLVKCMCVKFKWANPVKVPGTSKYCQSTSPPDYTPSSEPEPLRW